MTAKRQPLFTESGEQDSMKSLDVTGTTGGKATVETTVEPARPSHALAAIPEADRVVSMFERLAKDATVDVEKLEKLIAMQERILAFNAKAAFNAAFAQMQPEIPVLDEHGKIIVKGMLRSTFTPLEDIHEVVKPICARHGFAIRHRTEWPHDKPGIIRIVGILSHTQGHSEESIFEAPADKSDYRSDIQSMGSTVSYGRRYTTMDLLNISTRGQDKDGQKPDATPNIPTPKGFDEWWLDIGAVADNGNKALYAAWKDSKVEYRNYVMATLRSKWEDLKKKAAQVQG